MIASGVVVALLCAYLFTIHNSAVPTVRPARSPYGTDPWIPPHFHPSRP
jgi:hypothetical protein